MDAVKFMEEWQRMCDVTECDECSIKNDCRYGVEYCTPYNICGFENIVNGVEQWSREHTRKTRANDFWEKHPNAKVDCDFYTEFCCEALGYCKKCKHGYDAYACKDCWNEPV